MNDQDIDEWHGPDRGTHQGLGCMIMVASALIVFGFFLLLFFV